MGYNFYGWEKATVPPINNDFKGIASPQELYDALTNIWCEYTCAPRLRWNWSKDNVTLGQCSITSFIVQDLLGGEVCGIPLEGGGYHCFNEVGGFRFDLTSEQFGGEALDYDCCVPQSREAHFADADKYARYLLLKDRLLGIMR